MAKAIVKLCKMSERERRTMGRRGYEYVTKYHSVPVLAKKLLEVIEEATKMGQDRADGPTSTRKKQRMREK